MYCETFRIKPSKTLSTRIGFFTVSPPKNFKLHRSLQRLLARLKRTFFANTVKGPEAATAFCENPSVEWASLVLAVSKPGILKLRFTFALIDTNAQIVELSLQFHIYSRCFRQQCDARASQRLPWHRPTGNYHWHWNHKKFPLLRHLLVFICQADCWMVAQMLPSISRPSQ